MILKHRHITSADRCKESGTRVSQQCLLNITRANSSQADSRNDIGGELPGQWLLGFQIHQRSLQLLLVELLSWPGTWKREGWQLCPPPALSQGFLCNSLSCPQTHRDPLASASEVLGLKVCTTTAQPSNSVFWPYQYWPHKSALTSNAEPESKQYLCLWASCSTFPSLDILIWKTGDTATYCVLSSQ